jgi:phosphomannomutase
MSDVIKFGTDGWRAIIAEDFTFANVERVAYAVGAYVKETYYKGQSHKVPVLVGYDTRFLADRFAKRAAQVLISMGVPAKLAKRDVPTPAIAWATQLEPTAGAIQVTASHNPPEYCGIKYIPEYAGPATNEITQAISSHLKDLPDDFVIDSVEVPEFDVQPNYLSALESRVDGKRLGKSGLKVAYDALYSTSRGYLDQALATFGVTTKVLHNWRDPLFGGGMPEPKGEYLKELIKTVVEGKFDVGIATDGDADRFGVVDETGKYLSPNQLLALLARHLVKNRGQKGAIVRTVATSHLLDRMAEQYGLKIFETPVGFKYIGEIMRKEDVLIGGEESGGVSVKGHIPEKDGILANLLLIEMMAYEGKPLSQIWSDLQKEVGIVFVHRRADLHLNMPTQKALIAELTASPFEKIGDEKVVRVGRSDGLKLYLDDNNWLLVRPSGTEPLIRLYFEGTSDERIEKVMINFQKQIDGILANIAAGKSAAGSSKVEARA